MKFIHSCFSLYCAHPLHQKYIERDRRAEISIVEEVWVMGTQESKRFFEENRGRKI